MKTLFAYNENFAASLFQVLTSEELYQVKGGDGEDVYWEDEYNDFKKP